MAKTNHNALEKAKSVKNDEFYTKYEDIDKEMQLILESNSFAGKRVLLPCDNYKTSAFHTWFANNLQMTQVKQVTSCDKEGNISVLIPDSGEYHDRLLNVKDGFLDPMVQQLFLNDADIIVTNPPFSLLRDFVELVFSFERIQSDKKALILCPLPNSLTPFLQDLWINNKIRTGYKPINTTMTFNGSDKKFHNLYWLTNLFVNKNRMLPYHSQKYNEAYNNLFVSYMSRTYLTSHYLTYDNKLDDGSELLEVPYVSAIPTDWEGWMAIPLTFLEYLDHSKFEMASFLHPFTRMERNRKLRIQGQKRFGRVIVKWRKGPSF